MRYPGLISTDHVPVNQRFDYWAEEVVPAILPMALDSEDRASGRFWARMQIAGGDALKLFQVRSSSSTSRYEARHASGAVSGLLDRFSHALALNMGGADDQPDILRQYGRQASLRYGDCVLVDLRGDFANAIGCDNSRLYVFLSGTLVDYWLADNRPTALRIDGDRGWGRLLSNYLQGLAPLLEDELKDAPGSVYAQVSEHIASLLALALPKSQNPEDGYGPAHARWRELARAIKAWMREHQADAELTAARTAAAFHISVRQLHRVFAACSPTGQTFLDVLHAYRIEAAKRMLSDRRSAGLTIGVVGYRCGFANPATFSRVFREHTGMSPNAYRGQAARRNS